MPADEYFRQVMSGVAKGPLAATLRTLAAAAEPFYKLAISRRNRRYDSGVLPSHPLGRPTISVGNLSAGGTGKTPVVAFLANALHSAGHHPAILLRGYRQQPGQKSDEQAELESLTEDLIPIIANPDRLAGAAQALADHPAISCFLLDDAFQHRRAQRNLDIVLISATQGLCHHRLLPRGLLREPPTSLARADIILLTRADQIPPTELTALEREIQTYTRPNTPPVPLFHCRHTPKDILTHTGTPTPLATLQGQRLFAIAGTGDPSSFTRTLTSLGVTLAGTKLFRDHHTYTAQDRDQIGRAARAAGATALITTGKDAVKLLPLGKPQDLEILTLRIHPTFNPTEAESLLTLTTQAITPRLTSNPA